MSGKQIQKVENRLDADYASCFPSSAGWEKAATHLLLAYDFEVRAADTRTVDKMKYALMHTFRWGHNALSCDFHGYPKELDTSLFESCRVALQRGVEYTGICGAFISYHRSLVDVSHVDQDRIEFTPCPSWKAYDVLDEKLAFHWRMSYSGQMPDLQRIAGDLITGLRFSQPDELTRWFPDFGTARSLRSPVNKLLSQSFLLPQSWTFDGISALRMREFWRAIVILALIQCVVAYKLTGSERTSLIQLLVKPKDDLADWISACVGIEKEVAIRLLDLHTYDRAHRVPSIADTPFLPLAGALVAASPWMLVSSNLERNFCAHAARQHTRLYDAASNPLATHLANGLAVGFKDADFEAVPSVPFEHDGEKGDVDLLVWSPDERYVTACELKWVIAMADFMEVLNRGEKTCIDAMKRQLPKYAALLSADAGAFVAKAFELRSSPTITRWSCGVLVRGFVGTPRIPTHRYFLLPEPLARERLRTRTSLAEFCAWAKDKAYLPVEGQDFQMYPCEITAPSGVHVKFWEWEENE